MRSLQRQLSQQPPVHWPTCRNTQDQILLSPELCDSGVCSSQDLCQSVSRSRFCCWNCPKNLLSMNSYTCTPGELTMATSGVILGWYPDDTRNFLHIKRVKRYCRCLEIYQQEHSARALLHSSSWQSIGNIVLLRQQLPELLQQQLPLQYIQCLTSSPPRSWTCICYILYAEIGIPLVSETFTLYFRSVTHITNLK